MISDQGLTFSYDNFEKSERESSFVWPSVSPCRQRWYELRSRHRPRWEKAFKNLTNPNKSRYINNDREEDIWGSSWWTKGQEELMNACVTNIIREIGQSNKDVNMITLHPSYIRHRFRTKMFNNSSRGSLHRCHWGRGPQQRSGTRLEKSTLLLSRMIRWQLVGLHDRFERDTPAQRFTKSCFDRVNTESSFRRNSERY